MIQRTNMIGFRPRADADVDVDVDELVQIAARVQHADGYPWSSPTGPSFSETCTWLPRHDTAWPRVALSK